MSVKKRYKIIALHHNLFQVVTAPGESLRNLKDHEQLLQVGMVHQLRDAVQPAAVTVYAQFMRCNLPTSLLRFGGERLGRDLFSAMQVTGGGGGAAILWSYQSLYG